MSTYSIALRLRRVIYEDAYIAVPVTDEVLSPADDGTLRIDPDKIFASGLRIGGDNRVEWQTESTTIKVHPIQQSAPEGRSKLAPFYDDPEMQ